MQFAALTLGIFIILLNTSVAVYYTKTVIVPEGEETFFNESWIAFNPYTPLVNCSYLPESFMKCSKPVDRHGNISAQRDLGHGCTKWGGQRYEDVEMTRVVCEALPHIECYGDRKFLSLKEYPCIKYTGHYFVTTLIYSVLLGFLGMDRFCLGHTGTAVGKLLTLGGVGIWWIVDVILLVTGELRPRDDSNWVPFY